MPREQRPGCALYSAVLKLATTVLASALLTACATTKDSPVSEARIEAASDAFIIPPPGGPGIVSLVAARFPNAVRQDIFLATDARTAGENKIQVIMFTDAGGDGSDARLRDVPFTQVNLTEEALAAWPGSGMAVSPYYVQNDYGPFGYAIGKPANGDTCIYAWQRIAPTTRPSGAVDRGAVVIRLQLCRRGVTEQQLVEVMYKLRLDASLYPPPRAPQAIGALNAPIRPIGAEGFVEVIPSGSPAPRPAAQRPVTRAPAPALAPAVVVPSPAPGAPIVPSPSGSGGTAGPTVPRPPAAQGVTVPRPPNGSN